MKVVLALALGAIAGASAIAADSERIDTARLRWMSGCWEMKAGARLIEERWTPPRGGLMLGTSRTSRNDSIIEFEQMRIETRPAGVFFVASPSGQATTEFKATSVLDSSAVFENPEHDFPKKVSYRKVGSDSLVASIEGPRGGQARTVAFPYGRVSCDTP